MKQAIPCSARSTTRALMLLLAAFAACIPQAVFGAFGYTDAGTAFVVDSGAGLVFEVRKSDGNITSIVYNGVEYNGPSLKGSHIASGLGSDTTVTAESDGATYVKVVMQTNPTNGVASSLTHYLVVRNGENTIYMATFPTAEPNVGELRWITRLNYALLPNGPGPSDLNGNTGAIESSDIFGMADGTTRSKYYGDAATRGKERAMDLTYTGATGSNVGVWMIFGNRESSSGGPFFRDIQNQAGGDQEIYNYMNSGHNQTEPNRLNVLHGPYALVFNGGTAPNHTIDFSWMGSLGLTGWVDAAGRGSVSGTASGIPAGFQGVVGLANAAAQYWGVIAPDGSYVINGVKPGTYTATLYKGELSVGTASVTVAAGATSPLNLASTEPTPAVIFRIGEWDGTPAGLLNAANITQMHPSDVRNSPWGPVTYTVGASNPGEFPAVQFRGANSPSTIKFTLAPNQVANLTVRIGITCAYNGGRPQVTVNGFTPAAGGASSQPNSRSITLGTYRGNNALYSYTIPASALVAGTNTMTITPISGSTDSGTWLSAAYVYDAIELNGPIATPTISYVGDSPLVVTGRSEPGRTVDITVDGNIPAGTTVTPASGIWSIAYAGALSAGVHSVTAVASDGLGHSSPTSSPFTFDTGVAMPVITSAVGDTGTYVAGATTSDRVFTFTGTGAPGDTITLTRDGTGPIGSTVVDAGGSWLFDYTQVSLPDGTNAFYATAAQGGAQGPSSPVFSLTLQGVPRVAIVRHDPTAPTTAAEIGSVVFRVTFNHDVSGVTPQAFAVTTTNSAAGAVSSVSAAAGTVFDVTVGSLSGVGTLRIDLTANSGILDADGNVEAPYTAGETYTLVLPTTGNGVWTRPGSGGAWSKSTNWLNAVVADGSSASANFATLDIMGPTTVHLDGARTLNSATFGDTDVTNGGAWLIDSGGVPGNGLTFAGTNPSVTVAALGTGAAATLNAPLAGANGLTKAGPGTLVLTSANTLTGPLTLSGGVLQLAPGSLVSLGNSTVSVALNTSLLVNGGAFSTAGQVIAASGSVVVSAGTANVGGFRTNSTFGTTLRVNGGALTAGDVNIRRNAGTSPDFGSGFIVSAGSALVGTIGLGTENSYGCMSVEGTGAVTATGVVTIAHQATGNRGGALRVIGNATFTSTDGTLGVLLCRNPGSNPNNVGSATFTGGVSTVERFTLGFDAAASAGSATIAVNGGTLYIGGGGIVKNGAATLTTNLNFSSGVIGAKAAWSTALPVNLPNGGNVTFKAADAADSPNNITLSGVVGGAGGFTKTGDGTLTLAGAGTHSYVGSTTVNDGTLRVTGTISPSPNAITVNNGGAVAGNGTINRTVVLNAGGVISPDGATSLATLRGSSLVWNGDGVLAFDLDASGSSDVLALTGSLSQGSSGAYTFAFTPRNGFAVGNTYTLATFGSTTFPHGGAFAFTGLPPGTGAHFMLGASSLQILIQGLPSITSAATATGTFGAPFEHTITATELPVTFSATGLPPGLTVDAVTGKISGTPELAGNYTATLAATNSAGTGTKSVTITILKASAPVTLGAAGAGAPIRAFYTGAPVPASATTTPAGLNVTFLYDGSPTAPTLPGSYAVVGTVDDVNYEGTASGSLEIYTTALVRHGGTLDGGIDGSLQVHLAEPITLNSPAFIASDLLVRGTPSILFNGSPTIAGVIDSTGSSTPAGYVVTLNNHSVVRYVVRRVDPAPMPPAPTVAAPTGTRSVVLNKPTDSAGNFATLANLTLNSGAGTVVLPPGAYGAIVVNGGTTLVLGSPGAAEPSTYDLQSLSVNSRGTIRIVGPVVVRLASGLTLSGNLGEANHPEWFDLRIAAGGLTLNTGVTLYGNVLTPSATVTVNRSAVLHGRVTADRLVVNNGGRVDQPPSP